MTNDTAQQGSCIRIQPNVGRCRARSWQKSRECCFVTSSAEETRHGWCWPWSLKVSCFGQCCRWEVAKPISAGCKRFLIARKVESKSEHSCRAVVDTPNSKPCWATLKQSGPGIAAFVRWGIRTIVEAGLLESAPQSPSTPMPSSWRKIASFARVPESGTVEWTLCWASVDEVDSAKIGERWHRLHPVHTSCYPFATYTLCSMLIYWFKVNLVNLSQFTGKLL